MEKSFKLNFLHFIVFGVNIYNLHDRKLRIQGYFNFSFGGNTDEVINHKASILTMSMIKTNKMIVK